MRRCGLDVTLFDDLLSAFRAGRGDQALRDVGRPARLLPAIGESGRPPRPAHRRLPRRSSSTSWSDAVCTALQLTNFWQDLERRLAQGPRSTCRCRSCSAPAPTSAISAAAGCRPSGSAALRRRRGAGRARSSTRAGRSPTRVRGRLRWELRATWLGGMRILDRLERARFDVFRRRPTLGMSDMASIAWRTLWLARARR